MKTKDIMVAIVTHRNVIDDQAKMEVRYVPKGRIGKWEVQVQLKTGDWVIAFGQNPKEALSSLLHQLK